MKKIIFSILLAGILASCSNISKKSTSRSVAQAWTDKFNLKKLERLNETNPARIKKVLMQSFWYQYYYEIRNPLNDSDIGIARKVGLKKRGKNHLILIQNLSTTEEELEKVEKAKQELEDL